MRTLLPLFGTACAALIVTAVRADRPAVLQPAGKEIETQLPAVESLRFSPDGKRLLIRTNGVAWLFDVGKQGFVGGGIQGPNGLGLDRPANQPPIIGGDYSLVRLADFSPDGKALLVVSATTTYQRWDLATGRPLGRPFSFGVAGGPSMARAFSADRRLLLADRPGVVGFPVRLQRQQMLGYLLDSKTLKVVRRPLVFEPKDKLPPRPQSEVREAAFSPDGKALATRHADGPVHFWDPATGKPTGVSVIPAAVCESIRFSPDGRLLAAVCRRHVNLWEVATGRQALGGPVETDNTAQLAFSPDSRLLAVQGALVKKGRFDSDCGVVIDVKTGEEKAVVRQSGLQVLDFTPDGKMLAIGGFESTKWLWDPITGAPLGGPAGPDTAYRAAASPDGRLLATVKAHPLGAGYTYLRLWRLPGAGK